MLRGLIHTGEEAANAQKPAPTTVEISKIRTDGGTQPRDGLDTEYVGELVEALANGAALPPVDLMYDGQHYWLYDGFHRLAAHEKANRVVIAATVHQGDQQAAQWESYAANQSHGLRRSKADKERAIRAALKHPNGAKMADSLIAGHLGVSDKTVKKYRELMESASEIPKLTARLGADGKVYSTENIGANRPRRLSKNELQSIVRRWAEEHWSGPWPENPAHPDGHFLPRLATWMRGNVRAQWTEDELKAAIKHVHAQRILQARSSQSATARSAAGASAPSQRPDLTQLGLAQPKIPIEEWELLDFVELVASEHYVAIERGAADRYADLRTASHSQTGPYWEKLLRSLALFDIATERIQAAVAAVVERLVAEHCGRPDVPSTSAQRQAGLPQSRGPAGAGDKPIGIPEAGEEEMREAAPEAEDPAPAAASASEAKSAPAGEAVHDDQSDERIDKAIRLIGIYNTTLSTEDEYVELTGDVVGMDVVKVELQWLIDSLQDMVDSLAGRNDGSAKGRS